MKRGLGIGTIVLGACLLAGCPRKVGHDASVDSGYDPMLGNSFDGPILLDDARVQEIDPASLRAGSTPCRAPILARITRVIDGDTVHALGVSEVLSVNVRMIGIDTPEIAHDGMPDECYGPEAMALTGQLVDRVVWLTFDSTCLDPYNRLLAYVHIGGGEGDLWQRQLLRRGYARVLTVGDNRTFASRFEADANFAQTSGLGMWSACF